ncbi:MAG: polyprenyl synthetase family protein [Lutisporaceae bacterium]
MWMDNDFLQGEMKQVENQLKKALKTRNKSVEKALLKLQQSGGKRLRPALTILGGTFGEYNSKDVTALATAIEIIHMATLIHDDIIDDTKLRRGSETLHSMLGNDVAVYTGDFLFTRAFILIADIAEIKLMKDISRGIAYICAGEIDQNEQRYSKATTIRQYLKRISGKTAALFAVSLAAGSYKTGCPKKIVNKLGIIGKDIGMAFQIIDDVLDFTGKENSIGKPAFNDVVQGVYTLPVIFALDSKYKKETEEALDMMSKDAGESLRQVLDNSKAIDRAYKIAMKYVDKARDKTNELPDVVSKEIILDIIDQQINRKF